MKNCLIIDVETTGLDPANDSIIEIGAVLYSIEFQTTLSSVSGLWSAPANDAERTNRIPALAIAAVPHDREVRLGESIVWLLAESDVVVAHNAEFDRAFMEWFGLPELRVLPWLCTMFDFKWPQASRESQSLVTLALDHGIGVSSAHRALTDCQLIAALFDRMDDLPAMFAHAMRPKAMFRANVSYDDRQLAKGAGFQWDAESRIWKRRMAIEDAETLPFRVTRIEDGK